MLFWENHNFTGTYLNCAGERFISYYSFVRATRELYKPGIYYVIRTKTKQKKKLIDY